MDFLKANGAKLAIAVILLGVAGALAWTQMGDEIPSRANGAIWICVETGYEDVVPHGTTTIPPRVNPNTGRRTMLPALRNAETGKLELNSRYRPQLEDLEKSGLNKLVDTRTLQITQPTTS